MQWLVLFFKAKCIARLYF